MSIKTVSVEYTQHYYLHGALQNTQVYEYFTTPQTYITTLQHTWRAVFIAKLRWNFENMFTCARTHVASRIHIFLTACAHTRKKGNELIKDIGGCLSSRVRSCSKRRANNAHKQRSSANNKMKHISQHKTQKNPSVHIQCDALAKSPSCTLHKRICTHARTPFIRPTLCLCACAPMMPRFVAAAGLLVVAIARALFYVLEYGVFVCAVLRAVLRERMRACVCVCARALAHARVRRLMVL